MRILIVNKAVGLYIAGRMSAAVVYPSVPLIVEHQVSAPLFDYVNKEHKELVANDFLQQLMGRDFCAENYIRYLSNLLLIHRALERAQGKLEGVNKRFVFEHLFRSSAIEKDIVAWKNLSCFKEKKWPEFRDVEEIVGLIEGYKNPRQIIAAMWVFYGTLMRGTQLFQKNVERVFQDLKGQEGVGVTFFALEVEDVDTFRDGPWRAALKEAAFVSGDDMGEAAKNCMILFKLFLKTHLKC